jgi:hypothetical protein
MVSVRRFGNDGAFRAGVTKATGKPLKKTTSKAASTTRLGVQAKSKAPVTLATLATLPPKHPEN